MTIRTIERTEKGYALDGQIIHYIGRHPECETPDVLAAKTREGLHGALYDKYQCSSDWKEWDEFHIDGKPAFLCYSFHVIDIGDPAKLLARCEEDRTKTAAEWEARAAEAAAGRGHMEPAYIANRKAEEMARIDKLIDRLRAML